MPPIVIVESPYAGDIEANLEYVRACMAHSLALSEAPFASHALYTQPGVLDDDVPSERVRGIRAGFAFRAAAKFTAFYVDRGVSRGMLYGAKHCAEVGCSVRVRMLGYRPGAVVDAIKTLVTHAPGLPIR